MPNTNRVRVRVEKSLTSMVLEVPDYALFQNDRDTANALLNDM